MILGKAFYNREPAIVAKELLGNIFVRGEMEGKIVETEAYYGLSDPASRATKGKTAMSKWLWGEAGTIFVYMVHGYCLFNIITDRINVPSGVLLRAVEPLRGIHQMLKNRPVQDIRNITSGPGKLTQAFGIANRFNGQKIYCGKSEITIREGCKELYTIRSTSRIGVREDSPKPLRFYINGNPFVSRP